MGTPCIICDRGNIHTFPNPNELIYKWKIFSPPDNDVFCDYCFKLMMIEYNVYDKYLGEKDKEKEDLITLSHLESYWNEIKMRTKNKYPIEKKKDSMKFYFMIIIVSILVWCLILIRQL